MKQQKTTLSITRESCAFSEINEANNKDVTSREERTRQGYHLTLFVTIIIKSLVTFSIRFFNRKYSQGSSKNNPTTGKL